MNPSLVVDVMKNSLLDSGPGKTHSTAECDFDSWAVCALDFPQAAMIYAMRHEDFQPQDAPRRVYQNVRAKVPFSHFRTRVGVAQIAS